MSFFNLEWREEALTREIRSICRRVVRSKANDIAIDAKMNVPVDTGELLFSIEVKTFEKPDAIGAYIKAGGKKRGHIARFVELGTPGTVYKYDKAGSKRPRKGKPRKPVKAKAYLRPALKKHKGKFLAGFKDQLK